MSTAHIRQLGRRDYASVYGDMQRFTQQRDAATPDEIWVVEHDPVYTLGQAAKPEHVLAPGAIPVISTDRGGEVTYHGPGQLVIYPLLDLGRRQIGPRRLVSGIEQVLIDWLAEQAIIAQRKEGAPGVYVADAKIASIGLRVRKPGCYHGLALNLSMNLEPFSRINPCGYSGLPMCQVADWLQPVPALAQVGQEIATRLDQQLYPRPDSEHRPGNPSSGMRSLPSESR